MDQLGEVIFCQYFQKAKLLIFDIFSKMTIINIDNARSLIREILTGKGHKCIFLTRHCRQRMVERQVQMDDIFQVLFWGEIAPGVEPGDEEKGIFRISGKDLSEEPLTIVFQINPADNMLTCLSVF